MPGRLAIAAPGLGGRLVRPPLVAARVRRGRAPRARRRAARGSRRAARARAGAGLARARPARPDRARAARHPGRASASRPTRRTWSSRSCSTAASSTTPPSRSASPTTAARLDAWGAERIERRLRALGVAPEHVAAALGEQDHEGELEAALALLRRRVPAVPETARERDRALGMLVRKGYELELARDALRRYAGADEAVLTPDLARVIAPGRSRYYDPRSDRPGRQAQ